MDYLKETINQNVFEVAQQIVDEVPYWMHKRPILAVYSSIERCENLLTANPGSEMLRLNHEILHKCLHILTNN